MKIMFFSYEKITLQTLKCNSDGHQIKSSDFTKILSMLTVNAVIPTILNALAITGLVLLIIGKYFGQDLLGLFAYLCFGLLAFCGFSFKLSTSKLRVSLPMLFLFIGPMVFHYILYRDIMFFYLLHYAAAILIGFYTSNIFLRVNWNLVYYVYCAVVAILMLFSLDGSTESLNRTYYGVPLTAILLCSVIANYHKGLHFDVWPLLGMLVVAVMSLNRASFLLTLALLSFYLIYKSISRRQTILSFCLKVGGALCLIIVPLFLSEIIISSDMYQRLLDRGLDSGRFLIWPWYISQIAFENLIIGSNADQIMLSIGQIFFKENEHYSLHNVLLHTHVQGGIFAVFFVIYLFRRLIKLNIRGKDRIMVIGTVGLVFVKSCFEITMFPQFTDWIYFLLYFYTADTVVRDVRRGANQHVAQTKSRLNNDY
jgi:hypothetical protein